MKTTCEVCLFSTKDESGKQTGCSLNKLQYFDKEFVNKSYILDGYCNSCRNENWDFFKDNPEATLDTLEHKCYVENKLQYSIYILHLDNNKDLIKTIKSINLLNIKPETIYILCKMPYAEASKLYLDIKNYSSIKIKVDLFLEDISKELLLNRIFTSKTLCSDGYSLIIESGNTVNSNIDKLSDMLYNTSTDFDIYQDNNYYIVPYLLIKYIYFLNSPKHMCEFEIKQIIEDSKTSVRLTKENL